MFYIGCGGRGGGLDPLPPPLYPATRSLSQAVGWGGGGGGGGGNPGAANEEKPTIKQFERLRQREC